MTAVTQGDSARRSTISGDQPIDAEDQHPARGGRKRDHTRDGDILDAALAVLAEVGYPDMTMDMVAVRAKAGKATVYRRWSSKADLVIDAVARMKQRQVDLSRLPDTGTLRGDLVGLISSETIVEEGHKLDITAGLVSMLSQNPVLADLVNETIHEPWVAVNRLFIERAVARGEVSTDADIEMAARVIPSMAACRVLIQRRPVDLDFFVSLIDGLLLPALGNASAMPR